MSSDKESSNKETQDQQEFRGYCRAWLEENRPPPTGMPLPQAAYEVMTEDHRAYLVDWQSRCFEAGLIATGLGCLCFVGMLLGLLL